MIVTQRTLTKMAFILKPRVSKKRFPGLQFNLVVNGVEKDLTGATVNLLLNGKVTFSTASGTLIFSDRARGKVQLPAQILNVNGAVQITGSGNSGIGTLSPTGALEVEGGNVGIGTNVQPEVLSVKGGIAFSGNLAGGLTGNVGIGTTVTGAGATCDSSCNTAGKRCFGGIVTATSNFEPCSVSIIGDCICLPAT